MANPLDKYPDPAFNQALDLQDKFTNIPKVHRALGGVAAVGGIAFGIAHGSQGHTMEIAEDISASVVVASAVGAAGHRGFSLNNARKIVVTKRQDNALDWEIIHSSGLYKGDTTADISKVKSLHPARQGLFNLITTMADGAGPALLIGVAHSANLPHIPITSREAIGGAAATVLAVGHHAVEDARNKRQIKVSSREFGRAERVRRAEHARIDEGNNGWRRKR